MSIPHRCPVCEGRGVVRSGFYNTNPYYASSSISDEKCRTCFGTGILWEFEPISIQSTLVWKTKPYVWLDSE